MGKENGDENPEKNPLRKGFREIVEKPYKKSEFPGKKEYYRKGISGIYESVKNSVLEAISDETR